MDKATILEKVKVIQGKREFLEQLRQKPNIGNLRLDVTQALEELDELIDEFNATFPEDSLNP